MSKYKQSEFDTVETHTAAELEQAGYDSDRIVADWGGQVMPAEEADRYRR